MNRIKLKKFIRLVLEQVLIIRGKSEQILFLRSSNIRNQEVLLVYKGALIIGFSKWLYMFAIRFFCNLHEQMILFCYENDK